jgi:predicted nucleic acid-binding protein
MKPIVYDASLLVAADRNDRRVWAEHQIRTKAGLPPLVAAPVVAQVSRAATQANLRRFLRGCEVVPFDEADAHAAGALLAATNTSDVVDAAVVTLAIKRGASVLTGDGDDIRLLVAASGVSLAVYDV